MSIRFSTVVPLSQLSAGDHTIQFADGRQFLVHVPPTQNTAKLPVMFVFSGSAEPQYDAKDFAAESGMNGVADEDPKRPFVVVYPIAKKHKIGIYSDQPAWAYNAAGSSIDDQDRKNAGYDDGDFVRAIVDLLPQLTNVDSSHQDWGALAFSQGGVFLNYLVATIPNLFPSVGLIGTAMQIDYKYEVKEGNAKAVTIVELLGDKSTLPVRGLFSQSLTYDFQALARFFLHALHICKFIGKHVIERMNPLAAIHNEDESPMLQNALYTRRLAAEGKDYTVSRQDLATPAKSSKKDFQIDYVPNDSADHRRVRVYGLIQAHHSYPAPLYGARTNAQPKYTEFDASRRFAQMFNQYNDSVHAAHKSK